MARCTCGEIFESGCEHAMHKKEFENLDEHVLACECCGERIGEITEDFNGAIILSQSSMPIGALCAICAATVTMLMEDLSHAEGRRIH